jgi:hypothetical protein
MPLCKRLYAHVYGAKRGEESHKARWIRGVLSDGRSIGVVCIKTATSEADLFKMETDLITFLRACGARLTNLTDGGEGPSGRQVSVATRALISASNVGRKWSEESRANVSALRKGRKRGPHSAEHRAKLSAAQKGRSKSARHRQAMSVSRIGKTLPPHSAEWIANQAAGVRRAAVEGKLSRPRSEAYRTSQSENMRRVWAMRRSPSSSSVGAEWVRRKGR